MSSDEKSGTVMTGSARPGRRNFLKEASRAALGGVAGMLPTLGYTAASETHGKQPSNCRDIPPPMRDVAGKVAFITGGSSGIGLGIALAFADAGMKVAIGYRKKEHLAEAMRVLEKFRDRVHPISVDVTDRPGMVAAAAETTRVFGKVHVLVNNAGVLGIASLMRTSHADWDWMMNVNVNGVFNGIRAFLPRIQAHNEGGHIIATSSMGGFVAGGGAASAVMTKFAVVGMMESLRAELSETNIGVSIFSPGVVASNLADSSRNRPDNIEATSFDQEAMNGLKEGMKNPELAMSPLKAGQFALRGMRNNDLYIVTNPEFAPIIQDRSEALMASFPRDTQPTAAQEAMVRTWRQGSIYRRERARLTCQQ